RSLLPYLAVATALLAAACGDNPLQPKKPADPLATAANVQALGTSFTSLPFQSFSFATTYVPTAASPMAALRPLLRAAQPTLVTESSGNTQTLHVLVVGTTTDPPVTYLDYAVSVTLGAGTATVAVVGFITDGIERLDFNAAIGETTGSTTFDIRFDVNAADAH